MKNKTTYEEYLREKGELTYTFKGVSMRPWLIEGRDLFTVKAKPEGRCRKYDVVLYRSGSGQYILHRIIEVRETDYVLRGDNCINREPGIRDEDILGIMTSFVRNGREISVNGRGYQLLVRIWHYSYPVRFLWKNIKGRVGRSVRRFKKRQK